MANGRRVFQNMSVIPKSYLFDYLSNHHDETSPTKKRTFDKCTSVYKLTMLALFPGIKEMY